MLVTVTLYESTGLSPGNSMESIDSLRNLLAPNVKFQIDEVALKQDKGLSIVRLDVPYDSAKALDYAVIGSMGYWIYDITWLNDNCCSLSLVCDVITSVGIDNIKVLGGWCIRRCVTDDTLFSNTIPEPFTPTDHFVIVNGNVITHQGSIDDDLNLVIATTDLSVSVTDPLAEPWKVPEELVAATGEVVGVFTPRISPLDMFTIYHMDVWNGSGVLESKQTTVPYTSAFTIDSKITQRNLATVFALGLDAVIQQAYILPKNYVSQLNYVDTVPDWPWWSDPTRADGTLVDTVKCDDQVVASDLSPTYGQYHNNKVYTGQFMKVVLLSLTSGEEEMFDIEEIIADTAPNNIFWRITADVRYNGFPMCYPQTFKGTPNMRYLGAVKGAQWQTAPIKQVGESGELTRRIQRRQQFVGNAITSAIGGAFDTARGEAGFRLSSEFGDKSMASLVGSYLQSGAAKSAAAGGALVSGVVSEIAHYTIGSGYNETHVPSLPFNQLPTMQNYLGNDFYDYIIRLSDMDTKRLDDFYTQFGYAVNDKFEESFFRGRQYFNFVQAESISVRLIGYSDGFLIKTVKAQLEAGIRIWHVLPNQEYYTQGNPILEG